jgi:hypothetical protein
MASRGALPGCSRPLPRHRFWRAGRGPRVGIEVEFLVGRSLDFIARPLLSIRRTTLRDTVTQPVALLHSEIGACCGVTFRSESSVRRDTGASPRRGRPVRQHAAPRTVLHFYNILSKNTLFSSQPLDFADNLPPVPSQERSVVLMVFRINSGVRPLPIAPLGGS